MATNNTNLKTRLEERLFDIFPEDITRDVVYTLLEDADDENADEEILLQLCVDALILHSTAIATMNQPIQNGYYPSEQSGRNDADVLNDFDQRRVPTNASASDATNAIQDRSADGGDVVDRRTGSEAESEPDNFVQMLEMFPWMERKWLAEHVERADFDKEAFIDYVLTNSSAIPKKEKAKPAPIPDPPSTSRASGAVEMHAKDPIESPPEQENHRAVVATSNPPDASHASGPVDVNGADLVTLKDYINDSSDYCYHLRAINTQFLGYHFHWIAMKSIRTALHWFKCHLAPAFNAFFELSERVDFEANCGLHAALTMKKNGSRDCTFLVKIMKTPRVHIPLWSRQLTHTGAQIPDELRDEITWLQRRFDPDYEEESSAAQGTYMLSAWTDVPVHNQHASQSELSDDMMECGICYNECVISEQMVACTDGHLFCMECLRLYAKEAIYGQMKTDLVCMNDGCDCRFLHDMLSKALSPDMVEKLEEKRMQEAISSADIKGLERCKFCNYAVIFDVGAELHKVFTCDNPQCEREYCRVCYVDWEEHIGKTCRQVETEDETRNRREAEERMAAAVIRQCYKCKSPLIKEDGCNKMTCKCGALMCYLCREEIDGYLHFCRHPTDPGQPCSECTRCRVWENATIMDAQRVKQIQDEMNQKLTEAGKELKVGVDDSIATVPGRVQ